MRSPPGQKGVRWITSFLLVTEALTRGAGCWFALLLGEPSPRSRFADSLLAHATSLVSSSRPRAYAVQGVIGSHRRPPAPGKAGKTEHHKTSHKRQLSTSPLRVALVGSQKRL